MEVYLGKKGKKILNSKWFPSLTECFIVFFYCLLFQKKTFSDYTKSRHRGGL